MGSTPVFYLASTSKTLRDWLNMLPSVTSLVGDVGSVQVSRHREGFALEWHRCGRPAGRCMITDNILATTVLQMDSYCIVAGQAAAGGPELRPARGYLRPARAARRPVALRPACQCDPL